MKIGFINHSFILGSGIDTVIYELARHLADEHEVTVFTYYNQYDPDELNFEVKEIKIPFAGNRVSRSVISPVYIHRVGEIRREDFKFRCDKYTTLSCQFNSPHPHQVKETISRGY